MSNDPLLPKPASYFPAKTRIATRSQRDDSSEASNQLLHGQARSSCTEPQDSRHSSPEVQSPVRRDGSAAAQEQQLKDAENGFSPYAQGSSIVDLTLKIFNQHQLGLNCDNATFALPGGSGSAASSPYQARAATLRDLVGFDMPPRHVTDFLIDTYFKSVHWFMMVLDEPSFRENYKRIIVSGAAFQSELAFVTLLMMVLAIASRYATTAEIRDSCPDFDMESLQTSLLGKVKQYIYDLYDDACLEAVQITILLGSFYLYNAKPNLAFAILGAGIKCAQAMGLHLESTWKTQSEIVREMQRRTWWELFVFDRFASIVFGKPCSIRASDCKVEVSAVLNCFSPQHPDFQSTEVTEEGKTVPVTLYTYQRLKSRLYKIMSPVLESMHLLGHTQSKMQLSDTIAKVHHQLIKWHTSLPDELRLSGISSNVDISAGSVQSTFKMQALALQLGYDNIMIVLHRPLLLSGPDESFSPRPGDGHEETAHDTPRMSSAIQKAHSLSKSQCWESAIRTSNIIHHLDVLRQMKSTHAASYTGMHLFTAGVMLSIVAMSQPMSSKAQEAKRAIGGIIRLLNAFGPHTVLSAQSGTIMERLLRLIMAKEMKALVSDSHNSRLNELNLLSRQGSPLPDQARAQLQNQVSNANLMSDTPSQDEHSLGYYQSNSGSLPVPETSDPFGLTDFNTVMLSVQEVFRNAPSFGPGLEGDIIMQPASLEGGSVTAPGEDASSAQAATNGATDFVSMYGNSLGGLHDNGQMWLWDIPSKPF
ncbi:fungal zn2-cys6 binuclear cluster domain-containing isoform 1 [Fusarium longipes]|uniref:Fungal zn2-cys6 binuclear cluster domain-containing isoform 1 n=1 Tax=Fusarium longipes TaxID=694270 RepID=A0A395T0M7_9HYPO|nr:fungal zn2-cys6 binuclear cluster domain-containing isoform 1 [Fusarium longipes]